MSVANKEKVYDESFGHWLSGLFSAIGGNNPEMPFMERKSAFFELVRLWLRNGKIVFCDPSDPLNTVWKADADTIVGYLESHWPNDARDDDDPDLNLYFYEMPAILWVGDDGGLHGS